MEKLKQNNMKYIVVAIESGEVVDFVENINNINEAEAKYYEFKNSFGDSMTIQLRKSLGGGKEKIIKTTNKHSMFYNN